MKSALKRTAKIFLYLLVSVLVYIAFNVYMSRYAITTETSRYQQRLIDREAGVLCDKGGSRLPDTGFPFTTADVYDCNKEGKSPTWSQFFINTALYIAVLQTPATLIARSRLRRSYSSE